MQTCTTGQVLAGRYRLERELGRGGMATVFEATDLRHQRRVAVKTLDAELAAAVGHERFLREIRIVASLAHPHILPLHDSGTHGNAVFYVAPLVEGESLRARLQREGPLPIDEALRLGIEIAEALAYAHARGIIHRDVKPENILLHRSGDPGTPAWHALVADFGIARAAVESSDRSLTATGVSVGTPAYMSPEQALGEGVDSRSDVFSLGSTLFEMLTGKPTFAGESGSQTLARVLTAPVPRVSAVRPNVPAAVDLLLEGMLMKDVAARVPDAAVVARRLRDALERGASGHTADPTRRDGGVPRARIAVAAAVLALVATAAWALSRGAADAGAGDEARGAIAVLPFEFAAAQTSERHLADAIAEELVAALGQVPDLRVAAHTSSLAAVRAGGDLRDIGRRLGVRQVLEGTLRRSGDQLRVRVTLVNTEHGGVVWTDSLQRQMTDVFALQDELTRSIVARLRPQLGLRGAAAQPSGYVPDPESHDLVLQARYASRNGRAGLIEARDLAERAVARDSHYAAAWAQLSRIHQLIALFEDSTSTSLAAARQTAERAVALDSLSPEANAALGTSRFRYDWRWDEAERYLQRAIALNPSLAGAHSEYARFLRSMGRFREARRELERAGALDPLGGAARPIASGRLAFFERDFARAIRDTRASPETSGGVWLEWLAMAHIARGDLAVAESLLTRPGATQAPGGPFDLAIVYARTGRAARARALLDSLRTRSPVWASQSAWVWSALGETDSALKYLERAVATRDALVVDLKVHPFLDPLRSDPRFRRLLEALRFPE